MCHHYLVSHLAKCITLPSTSSCQCISYTFPSVSLCQVRHLAKCVTLRSASPCQVHHPDKCITLVMFWLLLLKVVVSVQSVTSTRHAQSIRHVNFIRYEKSTRHVKFIRHENLSYMKNPPDMSNLSDMKIYQAWKFTRHVKFAHVGSVRCSVLSTILRKDGQWCIYYILH